MMWPVLPSTPRSLLLCIGLAACASGGDDSNVITEGDGGTTLPSQDGSATDSSPGAPDSTFSSDVSVADTSTGGDASVNDAGSEGLPGDSSATETGPGDSGSTCADHGFAGALVTFDLSSQSGSETSAASTSSAAGATGGPITRSTGLTAASGSGSINSSGWSQGTTADQSLYYTFTVTPAAGCTITLTSLAIDVKASSTGPASVQVGTSVDSYTALSTPIAGTSTGTVPLSASASAPIAVTSSATAPRAAVAR